jgi:ring-1,2-phenylacetyl-CoA epoxidase subunit PaaC
VNAALFQYLLRLGDTSLVLGQRLGEWIGHAPALEEDLGLANLSLDLIGQARLLLTYAGEVEGRGRDEDALAYFRNEDEYRNLTFAEQPNGDFAQTIVRCRSTPGSTRSTALSGSSDARLAAIAAKSLKETKYHLRYSAVARAARRRHRGEPASRTARARRALAFHGRDVRCRRGRCRDRRAGIGPPLEAIAAGGRNAWVLGEAEARAPDRRPVLVARKRGQHSEHLGYPLAEMQSLQRAHPGAMVNLRRWLRIRKAASPRARDLEPARARARPEIPVLSVVDLGIVRDVTCRGEPPRVSITPTYSGCPGHGRDPPRHRARIALGRSSGRGGRRGVVTAVEQRLADRRRAPQAA